MGVFSTQRGTVQDRLVMEVCACHPNYAAVDQGVPSPISVRNGSRVSTSAATGSRSTVAVSNASGWVTPSVELRNGNTREVDRTVSLAGTVDRTDFAAQDVGVDRTSIVCGCRAKTFRLNGQAGPPNAPVNRRPSVSACRYSSTVHVGVSALDPPARDPSTYEADGRDADTPRL